MFKNIKADFSAGLVVFLVALPLCLGIGGASTGDLNFIFSGIIAGIIGGIVVGIFSKSHVGVSGPAAGLVVIVAAGIGALGYEKFILAVVIAGVLQWLAGFFKLGIIGHYFPGSVIKGMLAAIGIILILKEIPHALGYDKDAVGEMEFLQKDGHNTFTEILMAFKFPTTGAIIIFVICISLLIILEMPKVKKIKIFTFLPASLIVVIVGILINWYFKMFLPQFEIQNEHLVNLPIASSFGEFSGFFKLPDFSALGDFAMYKVAFTIAVVASLETLLCVEATDKLDPFKRITPTNAELKAQGIGNIISGLIGGLPITQVIVRSSANINAGGKTKLVAIIHGFMLLLSVILFPGIMNMIPMATLAAILILVGYKLAKISLFKDVYKQGLEQFIPFVLTIIVIIATDLLVGIFAGMCIAIFSILRKNYKHSYKLEHSEIDGRHLVKIRLSEEVTFLNKGSIVKTLINLKNGSKVIIDGSNSVYIDFDVAESIYDFKNSRAKLQDIDVELIDIPENEKVAAH